MKTQVNKPITTAQIKKIHVLLDQKGLMDEKKMIVYTMSEGRVESTKDLSLDEAELLINFLTAHRDGDKKKKKTAFRAIWHIAWEMGIIYGDTEDDYQMNRAKLNLFCRQRGTVKKDIKDQNLAELRKTRRQFEAMYKKHLKGK